MLLIILVDIIFFILAFIFTIVAIIAAVIFFATDGEKSRLNYWRFSIFSTLDFFIANLIVVGCIFYINYYIFDEFNLDEMLEIIGIRPSFYVFMALALVGFIMGIVKLHSEKKALREKLARERAYGVRNLL
jgi:hypothetical protein